MNKLKKIAAIVGSIAALIGGLIVLILSAGKVNTIRKMYNSITDTLGENVEEKNILNTKLDIAYKDLTAQEISLYEVIKSNPEIILPPDIDRNDPYKVLEWFREREKKYE